jgi:hypothetical protein
MKKIALLFPGIIFALSSCGILHHEENKTAVADSTIYIYNNITSLYGTDTTGFTFDTITKETFLKFKSAYHPNIDHDSTKVSWTDTSFVVRTKDSAYAFRTDISEEHNFCSYGGIIKSQGLFFVWDIDGHNEIGSLLIIDKKTNKKYEISSFTDDPCELPFTSPKNNYIASYANNYYTDNESFITLIKVNKSRGGNSYEGIKTSITENWHVKDLVWIDESSFALNVVTKTRSEDLQDVTESENYLRVSF